MYRHILIPTDGSELAERAVTHGLSLAIGAKVTVIIVEEQPSTLFAIPDPGVGVAFVELTEQIKTRAASALERTANAAKQAGVPCETVQVQDVQPPYEAIIAT